MRWALVMIVLCGCIHFAAAAIEPLVAQVDAGEEDGEEVRLSAGDIPTSIVRTEVGDWVEYAMADGSRSRLTVIERWTEHGDDHLVVQNKLYKKHPGRKIRKKDAIITEETVSIKERIADARDLGPFDFVTAGQILVDKRRIDVAIVNYVEDGQVVRQSYFSDEVPVYGLVRGVRIENGKKMVALNLKSFGQSGEDED